MYNFGDSLTDTGNVLVELPDCDQSRFPYGMTIHRATGRFCDGYLFLDQIAEAAGLPHLNPSENTHLDHSKGASFAVGGVGVLSKELRAKWNVRLQWSQSSLDVQFRWLEQLVGVHNFQNETARREHLRASLFLVGGGGNDYLNMKGGNYSHLPAVQQKIAMMPDIMAAINSYIRKLIVSYGATKVVAIGIYHGSDEQDQFYTEHNRRLQEELRKLREEFPRVRLVYGDVWTAVQFLLHHYSRLGYKHSTGEVCCGDRGDHPCGSDPSVPYCRNPNQYWFWDGQHLTSYTHRLIAARLIPQIAADLACGEE